MLCPPLLSIENVVRLFTITRSFIQTTLRAELPEPNKALCVDHSRLRKDSAPRHVIQHGRLSAMKIQFEAHQRLCYYPSCHHLTPWILLGLDCDLFIMSEKEHRSSRWKSFRASFERHGHRVDLLEDTQQFLHFHADGRSVWIFREDNRQTLARIAAAGLKIHHFVGIRDGCMEGGNHECVNERPFLSHLLPLAAEGMRYTTDHMPSLQLSWQRRRKFRSGDWKDVCLSEPSMYPRYVEPDNVSVPDELRFELQGVLVREGLQLRELDFGLFPTSLETMRPFRLAHGIGILAEYRISVPEQDVDAMLM